MTTAAIITIGVIVLAIILFATEALPIDLVAISIMIILVIGGVITPEEGVEGFSNKATITVAFMFVLSAALLKTGALQVLAHRLSKIFRYKFNAGILMMMFMIAIISAFVNNTPVVAVFIPVVIQIAHASGQSPSKMLIPLSFASIFGGMCTLIGTSTNILVSGIAEKEGEQAISMFQMTPIAGVLLVVGVVYMSIFGIKLLPKSRRSKDLKSKFDVNNYITLVELLSNSSSIGKKIMDSELVTEFNIDIIEVRRNGNSFTLPPGDFELNEGDILKVKCDVEKLKSLKGKTKTLAVSPLKIGDSDLSGKNSALVEMVITSSSEIHGKTLKELDFRRRYRAIPLAIKHKEDIKHDDLYDVKLSAGDVILAEVKSHYVKELNKLEAGQNTPFVLLSENHITEFDKKKFGIVIGLISIMVVLASLGILDIMVGAISAVIILVLAKILSMKEIYEAINWKIIFLLVGALSLGLAINKTGLDLFIAEALVDQLAPMGIIAVISGLYLATSLLTEVMSNNASAALMTPIAIAIAHTSGVEVLPFLVTVMIAASATFMTPIGYQTNTMVYSAGNYKFKDFFKVGIFLNFLFWVISSFMIPWYFNLV
ncbi:sodium/TCA dicarboxylates symporter, putative [Psychroflexus gondwanensis ACAM 44]|jgi:di/tricarboxylate transporter|uniref:Sodium/TCA dicarboxylates symporter, putative n=1 Tax=Psychroflexus gondwanensis ACAM 44 TaxID=1189619 RepID=N1X121_9FLAO|nr:SLC13 family permease [Psychroflexus gondwanensis]EMY81753.1 sodium/TCA dicarboxylates symporter, putative [Psychroflexus gondwanensis ACAM 44]